MAPAFQTAAFPATSTTTKAKLETVFEAPLVVRTRSPYMSLAEGVSMRVDMDRLIKWFGHNVYHTETRGAVKRRVVVPTVDFNGVVYTIRKVPLSRTAKQAGGFEYEVRRPARAEVR